jgi:hypothetical protein
MELDMHVYCLEKADDSKQVHVWYWRKHDWLNKWLCDNYSKKKNLPNDFDFNGVDFELGKADLHKLRIDISEHVGEFENRMGHSRQTCQQNYNKFIDSVCTYIDEGDKIFYCADW